MPLKIAPLKVPVGAGPLFREIHMFIRISAVCTFDMALILPRVEVKGGTVDVRFGGRIVHHGDRVFG